MITFIQKRALLNKITVNTHNKSLPLLCLFSTFEMLYSQTTSLIESEVSEDHTCICLHTFTSVSVLFRFLFCCV